MSIVSVQKFQLTLGNSALTDSATLAGGTVAANCVPFTTTRVTKQAAPGDDVVQYVCDIYIQFDSPDWKVYAERGLAELGEAELVCEVTVVEFDGSDTVVLSGTYNDDTAVDVGTLDDEATFLYVPGQCTDFSSWWTPYLLRSYITADGVDSDLAFTRADTGGTYSGHWYAVTATAGEFTVQARTVVLGNSVTSNAATIDSITTNKTFLIGSYSSIQGGNRTDNNVCICDATLTDDTTITVQRDTAPVADGVITWHGYAVTMTDNTMVYRNTLNWAVSETTKADVSIGATVDTDVSMVHVAGSVGTTSTGSGASTNSDAVPDMFTAWTFTSPTALTVEHITWGSEDDLDISWEVIEWDVDGAPPPTRRVMVIS
jgi:hypothetical protein